MSLISLEEVLAKRNEKREADAQKYVEHDTDLCMLCHAYGEDKRSLHISAFYAIEEVVPEALELISNELHARATYYVRMCKSCRARLLGHLREWRDECVALRDEPKDHDGYIADDEDPERNIPVRIDGVVVRLTREEWDARVRNDR